MSLMTYKDARPWARAIKERVLMRDMPPWHLDKTAGIRRYKNDISLTDREIDTIVKWVDAGAPEGAADMQKMLTFASEDEWFIGKPDLLVTTSDFTMYSNGPDWWIDQFAEMTLTEDRGNIFAENTGMLLKAGTRLRFDMQCFAIGFEQDNRTTIAFKFYPKGFVTSIR